MCIYIIIHVQCNVHTMGMYCLGRGFWFGLMSVLGEWRD